MFNYDNIQAGKVIIALNTTLDSLESTDDILSGIEYEKVELIFPCKGEEHPIRDILLVCLGCEEISTVINTIQKLEDNEYVTHAEPNFLFDGHKIPNDPYYNQLWGLTKIKAPQAWDYTTGGTDVIVGVMDSGIDHSHPDIAANMWSYADGYYGWNFINDNSESMDTAGHGTHVAGIIGAVGNNAIGITGVCWKIKLAALRIGNKAFSLDAAIRAIDFANVNRISILNNSWGGRYNSPSLKHAIDHYNGLFIASAGNDGVDSDITPDYPAAYDNENIISVAATDSDDALASFSNYGAESVDIAAPGTNILSLALNNEYSSDEGTSMSTPFVSGVAALLKSYKPDLTALEIKDIILSSVDKYPSLEGKILSGGVLNMFKAIQQANITAQK